MKKTPNKWFVLWFTGLSWAGKTTSADAVFQKLKDMWFEHVDRLDGDIVRESLTKDLGFTKADRDLNIARVSFVAEILSRNGVWVLSTFVSPYKQARENLRDRCTNYIVVFVNAPLAECEKRDVKWLYQKARDGIIPNFTGISDPYESPENPEIELRTDLETVDQSAQKVIDYLFDNGYLTK